MRDVTVARAGRGQGVDVVFGEQRGVPQLDRVARALRERVEERVQALGPGAWASGRFWSLRRKLEQQGPELAS